MSISDERLRLRVNQPRAVVLLVHRDDDSRQMYEEFLRHHGVDLVCSTDVTEALRLAEAADVIVTELRLPNAVDGCDLIERLRADRRTRSKRILVVTSWAWQTERVRAEVAGCDLFLIKPCLPDVLLQHVRRAFTDRLLDEARTHRVSPQSAEPA